MERLPGGEGEKMGGQESIANRGRSEEERKRKEESAEKEQEKIMGSYSRENQLASAAACTSFKATMYIDDALKCKNTVLLDKRMLIRDFETGEIRIKELTALMIACIMGNMKTVQ